MDYHVQGPDEVLLYEFAWSNTLPAGATIAVSTWEAPAPLVVTDKSIVVDSTQARITGCVVGNRYTVTNTVTLSNGEVYEQSAFIWCEVK